MKLDKQTYIAPEVTIIELDNEISLVLASDPPIGPGEVMNQTPDFFNSNDPYKMA